MFDVITFGSATEDIFVKVNGTKVFNDAESLTGRSFSFPLGTKVDVEDLFISTGGGGTNTAVTFANQGFKVASVVKIGKDNGGKEIMDVLKEKRVSLKFIVKDSLHATARSIILSFPEKERTILVYRGASAFLSEKDIPFSRLKAKWFYLAPLPQDSADLLKPIVDFAHKNGIKIAINPGNSEINLGDDVLKPIFNKADLLILNKEEASLLTKVPKSNETEVLHRLKEFTKGIIIVTKGGEGALVVQGDVLYRASAPETQRLVEKTGAGDAFASGFLSGYIKKDIVYGIQFGVANATSCIREVGAKNGLLPKDSFLSIPKVNVEKETF